ncbi:MAG: hypothetical protein RB289_06810 [Paludibacter sp.]|jgi:hypothetical protein|nr:hypothetical protein [Paludibacter sp.]MBP8782722.1 hypothetical protein [Paludibacter sp.]MDX9919678.1 hypothetical protein [Paludibacter sp.]
MNRKLIVTLLHKNIEELSMITESFMEMEEYPAAIVHIAKRKTEDIQLLIEQLAGVSEEKKLSIITKQVPETTVINNNQPNSAVIATPEIPVEKNNIPEVVIPQPITIKEEEKAPEPETFEAEVEIEEITSTTVETQEPDTLVETTKTTETFTAELKSESAPEATKIEEIEIKTVTEETRKTTIADKIIQPTVSRNEAHSKNNDNSLSASIANKKISDIKTAISIGDRFRFQRELFRGNGEDMNKTLNYINQLATFDEVHSFLQSKYSWDEENDNVEDFYQIAKRKFI